MKRLLIIDAHALIHRAYHALPKLKTKKSEPINAVYGFLLVFLKAIKDLNPDYICACFDLPEPTFRHKEFDEYKAQRPKTPEDLSSQIPKVKELLEAFSVPIFEKKGFEADDIIATIAAQSGNKSQISKLKTQNYNLKLKTTQKESLEIIVLTGDLDMLQLVDDNTKVYTLRRGVKDTVLYDENKVFERYGFSPVLLPDFKALVGDASDNIPGVPGIGKKTAPQLLKKFGSLESMYEEIEKGSLKTRGIKPRIKKALEKFKNQAFLSKSLASIRYDVPIDFDLEKCKWRSFNREKAVEALKKIEFHSLIERLPGVKKKSPGRLF